MNFLKTRYRHGSPVETISSRGFSRRRSACKERKKLLSCCLSLGDKIGLKGNHPINLVSKDEQVNLFSSFLHADFFSTSSKEEFCVSEVFSERKDSHQPEKANLS
ncbi:hypothetical protein CSUI_004086 [Cystoisospora suis]|uniref:Uncharacterized protein n=1 Tax=Cystoisospora suis TaxID=483139 RepID=A0A2C6L020_9APIC|nr:hypothetical protein CSUI_004086 [Cystoisospora suis]